MSNYEYEDDDDDFTQDSSNDLVKQLRKAAKQKDKELQELRAQFEGLNKAQRERAIKDALAARGVNQKISSFIPSDIFNSNDLNRGIYFMPKYIIYSLKYFFF